MESGDTSGTESGSLNDLKNADETAAQTAERRVIREGLHKVIADLKRPENKPDFIDPANDTLSEKLHETSRLFNAIKKNASALSTREAELDSQAMCLIAALGKQKAQAISTEFVKFDPLEFSSKLTEYIIKNHMQNDTSSTHITADGWQTLGEGVQGFFRKSPAFFYMNGSFERDEIQMPVKKQRIKDKDNILDKATVPLESTDFSDNEKNEETTKEVQRILEILHKEYNANDGEPVCFFEFVVNPDSFGQTVENLFHVSFLIRDGHARVFLDDEKLPAIEPITVKEGAAKGGKDKSKREQCVMSLTPADWERIKETYQIDQPKIPSRPKKAVPKT